MDALEYLGKKTLILGDVNPELQLVIETALANNLDLQIAAARVEEFRGRARVARSYLGPNVNLGGSTSPSPGTPDDSSYSVGLTLNWEIHLFGRLRRANEAARAQLLATEDFQRGVINALVADVATTWFRLREIDEEIAIIERTIASQGASLDLVRSLKRNGVASATEEMQALSQLAATRAQLPQAELTRVQTENLLRLPSRLRARGITQHFLRLSRGQAASADLVNVCQTLSAVARLVEPTARAHGVKIAVPPAADVLIRVDDAELQHVLINLTLNAVQASTPGGEVTLLCEASEPARVRVIDHGGGIAPENQKRIFEPFFSLRKGGTGLGLFLSLNFARHWGGDITITSTPGGGATFDVVLPATAGLSASRTA